MASNITNDAAALALEMKQLMIDLLALEGRAVSLQRKITARGVTWDGTTTGVSADVDLSNGVTALNNLQGAWWTTYGTNIIKCAAPGN
ncbi:MAG: hypothetical protein NVS9B9_17260 [Ktedonobacteraceae bacterium]